MSNRCGGLPGLSLDEGFTHDESTILKFRYFLGEYDLTGRRDFATNSTKGTKRSAGNKVRTASGSDRVKPSFIPRGLLIEWRSGIDEQAREAPPAVSPDRYRSRY